MEHCITLLVVCIQIQLAWQPPIATSTLVNNLFHWSLEGRDTYFDHHTQTSTCSLQREYENIIATGGQWKQGQAAIVLLKYYI